MAERRAGATFTSFRALSRVEDPEQRRELMLDCLDNIRKLSGERERVSNGVAYKDPDFNAMVKCAELAASLLGIESKSNKPNGSLLGGAFERKEKAA